jgi:subtilase family serine protease
MQHPPAAARSPQPATHQPSTIRPNPRNMYASAAIFAALIGQAAAMPYNNGWVISPEPVGAGAEVTVTIVVREQGAEKIRRIAHQVSDPSSPSYGDFLTSAQITDITAPRPEDMKVVTTWLESHGVGYQTRHSNVVAVMTVATASELFSTSFHTAVHPAHGQSLIRAGDYSLPSEVQVAVQTIFGLHGLPLPPRAAVTIASHSSLPGEPAKVTPDVIHSTYGVGDHKGSSSTKNRQAVAEFQGQFMNSTDLKSNFKRFVEQYTTGTDDVVSKFVGVHKENSGGVEAELDIQYIMAPAVGILTEFWEFPGDDFGADLNQWSSNLTLQQDVPLVHSVSYGWQGNLSQIHVKESDVATIDSNLQKMAAKGLSVMVSSGDSGSGYTPSGGDSCSSVFVVKKATAVTGESTVVPGIRQQQECCDIATSQHAKAWTFVEHLFFPRLNTCTIYRTITGHKIAKRSTTTGTLRGAAGQPALWPSWPASSPWVTAVGATRFVGHKVGNTEMATDQFGSGVRPALTLSNGITMNSLTRPCRSWRVPGVIPLSS